MSKAEMSGGKSYEYANLQYELPTKPYFSTMLIICDALVVRMSDLIESGSMGLVENEEVIVHAYCSLSSEKKRMLEVYADMLLRYDLEL